MLQMYNIILRRKCPIILGQSVKTVYIIKKALYLEEYELSSHIE